MLNGSGIWQRTNVYAGGTLIGTYDLVGNPDYNPAQQVSASNPEQIPWLHFHLEDALGTRRMQISGMLANLGQPEMDFQSLPFGDGLSPYPDANSDQGTELSGFLGSTPLFFTGKERDSESGNDYFKYRYLASSMGRWLSPDPSGLTHVDLGNPQELNLYNYVGNNPLTRADLDGLCIKGFQWACDIIQRIDNRLSGYGFQTDDQLLKTPNKRSQNKIGENRRQETSLKDLSKQPFKPIDLQFDPNAPPVPRLSVRATPAPKKPEPPGWYECLTVPGDATAAYRDSMAAYNSAAQGNSAPSDDDTSANGVGGGAVLLNLTGKGWSPQGSADAATKVNGAAAIADYGVSAGGCFVQH
jgi:RHS repeat-associated protein